MELPKVDLSRWTLRELRVQITWAPVSDDLYIDALATARNVETGQDGPLCLRETLSRRMAHDMDSLDIKRIIAHAVKRLLMHELDECLYFNDERFCKEPHPER